MEHDINRLIREKVRAVEGQPVPWQKERVWQMIRTASAHEPYRAVYYYSAASIAILIAVIFYAVQLENQKQVASRIAALESAINDKYKLDEQRRDRSGSLNTEVERICPKNIQSFAMTQKIRPIQGQKSVNTLPEIIPEVKEVQSEIAVVTINDDPVSGPPVEITPEPKAVEAILGFIPKTQEAVASKVKKTKFRLFKNHDGEHDILFQEESRLLTARIN